MLAMLALINTFNGARQQSNCLQDYCTMANKEPIVGCMSPPLSQREFVEANANSTHTTLEYLLLERVES